MPLDFASVIPRLLEVAQANPILARATQVAVVRNRQGIVRLAAAVEQTSDAECAALEHALTSSLGGWYRGPTLRTDDGGTRRRLALEVLNRARNQWPESWPRSVQDPVRGTLVPLDLARWGAVQRVLSKETWLTKQQTASPWPLRAQTPKIASFYSYKGGVGRSTLVAIVASLLASTGEEVVIVDLDLEAPGQQVLFDVIPSRGVIDYVVEHIALDSNELTGLLLDVTNQVADATGKIYLAPAGAADWSYVEKLARLDFAAQTSEGFDSPAHAALSSLLKQIRSVHNPDWILLDARTGIHDLGGLAMHAFAHIDVLVGRDGRQATEGLELCLEALARRRSPDDIRTLIVHALAPAPLDDAQFSLPIQRAFREKTYELFRKTIYESMADLEVPAADDRSAQHSPFPVPLDPTFGRIEALRAMDELRSRSHYISIVERLRELAEPEEDSE